MLSRFSLVQLFATPGPNRNPPGSSVHGILQARILESVACPPPDDLHNPGIEPPSLMSLALAGGFFNTLVYKEVKLAYPHLELAILEGICKKSMVFLL